MLNIPSVGGLSWVYEQIEDRLTSGPLALKLIDSIDPANGSPMHISHRGVAVTIPTTTNTGLYRDDTFALASDRVEVSVSYQVRPEEQRASRREAIVLEEQVRVLLTDEAYQRDLHLAYDSTSFRGPHPQTSEFYLITQVFTTKRDAALGGFDA